MSVFRSDVMRDGALDLQRVFDHLEDDLTFEVDYDVDNSDRSVTSTSLTLLHQVAPTLQPDEFLLARWNMNYSVTTTDDVAYGIYWANLLQRGGSFAAKVSGTDGIASLSMAALIYDFGSPNATALTFWASTSASHTLNVWASSWNWIKGKRRHYNERILV